MNESIDFGDVNAPTLVIENLVELFTGMQYNIDKEKELYEHLKKAIKFIGVVEVIRMKYIIYLLMELAIAKGISFEELSVSIPNSWMLDELKLGVNLQPNQERAENVLRLVRLEE